VGTWDGANIEMAEQIGPEHLYIFGLRAEEVEARRHAGYQPHQLYTQSPVIRRVLDALVDGRFGRHAGQFQPIVDSLLHHDTFFVLADFEAYVRTQERVSHDFRDPAAWHRTALLNIARMGHFSSDRTIREYARDIWRI
jgi:starch phosphorylase